MTHQNCTTPGRGATPEHDIIPAHVGKTPEHDTTRGRRFLATGLAAGVALTLAACAGGTAGGGDGGGGEGVDFGASPEEYQAALEEMEPVTLTYQPGSQSAQGATGEAETAFIELVEEWSGGKITLEPVWAQAIAPFDEVTEAAADGRIDIGTEIPIYTPSKYQAINDLINLTPSKPASPYRTELVTSTALLETSWNTPEIVENYEEMGVTVLRPTMFEFSNALMCTEPVTSLDDFNGKQIRVGSAADLTINEALGSSGVSMQFGEAFDALQRNTVDCTFGGLRIGSEYGFLEVAPNVTFPSEGAWVRNPTAVVAGPGYQNLPLAAQQLIFDAFSVSNANTYEAMMYWVADAMGKVEEHGGEVNRLDAGAEEAFAGAVSELQSATQESGAMDGVAAQEAFDANYDKWTGIADELGLPEFDDYMSYAEAYRAEPIELDEYSQRIFEEIYTPHRPS
ncbi:C4-dicarboxylate ABC transporter substrate-binding protein [Brevibacterium litoralis]|uniref:C4-dicarboxylate ABC transporter substrate-binding protein n=1 Tax=Brevibacterium litoralis TaxID=3138935 RepID=UPI0032EAF6FB